MPKSKKDGATRWRKKCVTKAKEIARRIGYCERCGQNRLLQGSHIISEGVSKYMSVEPDNILCLCVGCHLYWRHKEPLQASRWFEEKRPGRYDELLERDQNRPLGSLGKPYWVLKREQLKNL